MNDVFKGNTHRIKVGCGYLYATLATGQEGALAQVRLGKGGTCASSQCEALGRAIAVALRHGATMNELSTQLKGITCSVPTNDVKSCADGIAQILEKESSCSLVDGSLIPEKT